MRIIHMGITVICLGVSVRHRPSVGTDQQNAVRLPITRIWSVVAVPLWHASSPRVPCEMYVQMWRFPLRIGQWWPVDISPALCGNFSDSVAKPIIWITGAFSIQLHVGRSVMVAVHTVVWDCSAGYIYKLDGVLDTLGVPGEVSFKILVSNFSELKRDTDVSVKPPPCIFPTNCMLPLWLCCFKRWGTKGQLNDLDYGIWS